MGEQSMRKRVEWDEKSSISNISGKQHLGNKFLKLNAAVIWKELNKDIC